MKKVFAFIFLICIVFNSVSVSVSAGETDSITVDNHDYSKELYVFEYLEALNGMKQDEINTSQKITRAEFVSICAKALALPGDKGEKIFFDVDEKNSCFNSIYYLVNAGVLSVGLDREFRPNDDILYSEALKILLSLAGYDVYASENGGYPLGYINTSNRFKFSKDKKTDDTLSYGEALELMFDIMTTGIYDVKTIGKNTEKYSASPESTLLSIYRNVYVERGTLETTSSFSMYDNMCNDNEVIISGTKYQIKNGFNVTGFEGNYVEYVYHDNNTNDELICMESIADSGDVSITSKEYVDFSPNSYVLTYYKNLDLGRTTTVQIDKKWKVIYNGMTYNGSLSEVFQQFASKQKKGTIEIKRNYNDQGDSVLIIKSYRTYIVKNYDLNTQVLYNKFVTSDTLKLNDYISFSVYDQKGNPMTVNDIVPEQALLVAESADGEYLGILMPSKKMDVTVKSIGSDNVIETEEEDFTVDELEWERIKPTIEVGATYTIWVDAFDEVIYMTLANSDHVLLGFIAGSLVKEKFGKPDIKIKMFAQDGTFKVLNFANSVTIDGELYNNMLNALFAIPETDTTSGFDLNNAASRVNDIRLKKQLVRYCINSNDEITYIDTYYVNVNGGETKETSLTKYEKRFQLLEYRQGATSRFDRDVLYSPTMTKTFTVPWTDDEGYMIEGIEEWKIIYTTKYQLDNNGNKKREEDDMYKIGAQFTDYRYFNVEIYDYDSSNPFADVIVNYDDFIGRSIFTQVRQITKKIDGKGNTGYGIKVLGPGGEQEFFTELDSQVADLHVGDIILAETYESNIFKITKVFDCQKREFVGATSNIEHWYKGDLTDSTDTYRQQNQFSKGTIVDMKNDCVFWKYELDDPDTEYDEAADLSIVPFTVYERDLRDEPTLEMGTTDRIKDYLIAGDDASYIVCKTDLNRVVYAFIFNGR